MWVLVFWGFVWGIIIVLGIFFYLLSVASRKRFRCPQCGEYIQTEYLVAKRCNLCGAPLREN